MVAIDELKLPIPLTELRNILRAHGVQEARVYGSYARGEANSTSDLDLLVKLRPGRDLFDLAALQRELERLLPCGVDLAMKLHPRFEPYIAADLVRVL